MWLFARKAENLIDLHALTDHVIDLFHQFRQVDVVGVLDQRINKIGDIAGAVQLRGGNLDGVILVMRYGWSKGTRLMLTVSASANGNDVLLCKKIVDQHMVRAS